MTKHRIILAGATGQVGSKAVRILFDQAHVVRALVRCPQGNVLDIERAKCRPEYAVGSLEKPASLVKALDKIDTLISSASGIIAAGKTMSVTAMYAGG